MTKRSLIVGNWKMELSHKAALELALAIRKLLRGDSLRSDVVVCPSFVSIPDVCKVLEKQGAIGVGAQNIHWDEKGAWTGEVSVAQIRPFVKWCIIGHSEQRALTGETDEQVLQKAHLLITNGIAPIICIGETREERDKGNAVEKVTTQMKVLLSHIDRSYLARLVIAYEPIWAIGTGVLPHPDDVAEVILLIRRAITTKFDDDSAERLRILYGGSVKAKNVAEYISGPGADGVLAGGASIHPKEFVDIVKDVEEAFYA